MGTFSLRKLLAVATIFTNTVDSIEPTALALTTMTTPPANVTKPRTIKGQVVTAATTTAGTGSTASQEGVTLPPLGAADPISIMISSTDPYFDVTTQKNLTALVGKTAYLTCIVHNLGNKTVSWIRHRDLHILTAGSYTYTSDQRYQANHLPNISPFDWTLQIKWAQKRDAGIYECQINTQPVRSYFVYLNVVDFLPDGWVYDDDIEHERRIYDQNDQGVPSRHLDKVPTALILGAPDIHVDKGSTINLTCSIKFSPEPPAYIFWYHGDDVCRQVISYDSARGGVSVITEKGDVTTSYLLIQHASVKDSGRYSCSPSNAEIASVKVHVLNGERPAAMQTGSPKLSKNAFHHAIVSVMVSLLNHAMEFYSLSYGPLITR